MSSERTRVSVIAGHLRHAAVNLSADTRYSLQPCAATQTSRYSRAATVDAAYSKAASLEFGRAEQVYETALLYSDGVTHGNFDNHEVVKHNQSPPVKAPTPSWQAQVENQPLQYSATENWAPQVDFLSSRQGYTFNFKLPGVKADDIHLDLRGNQLSISGRRLQGSSYTMNVSHDTPFVRRLAPAIATWRKSLDGGREVTVGQERQMSNFCVIWTLPKGKYEDMHAEFAHGKLRVTLPHSKEAPKLTGL